MKAAGRASLSSPLAQAPCNRARCDRGRSIACHSHTNSHNRSSHLNLRDDTHTFGSHCSGASNELLCRGAGQRARLRNHSLVPPTNLAESDRRVLATTCSELHIQIFFSLPTSTFHVDYDAPLSDPNSQGCQKSSSLTCPVLSA